MLRDEQPDAPDSRTPPGQSDSSSQFTVESLFRVTRRFLVPFLLSWFLAYVGGEWEIEWLYYAGLSGVGLSVIGLLLWLLRQ